MDKELIQFIQKNKDVQIILKIIMTESGTLEIKYKNGKIYKKKKEIEF